MGIDSPATEHCAVCGADTGESHAFCHFYPEGRRVALCGPTCAEHFMRGSGARGGGDVPREFLQELAQEKAWSFWRS